MVNLLLGVYCQRVSTLREISFQLDLTFSERDLFSVSGIYFQLELASEEPSHLRNFSDGEIGSSPWVFMPEGIEGRAKRGPEILVYMYI